MTPEQWTTFWGALILLAVLAFGGLAVQVAIGGARDVRSMLRTINRQHGTPESPESDLEKTA